MFIKSLKLTNLLSYGQDSGPVELRPLNVLIGPNGSGKSNFIEAIALLHAAPNKIADVIRSDSIKDWLHKSCGEKIAPEARIEAVLSRPGSKKDLRYSLAFCEAGGRFEIIDEYLENESPDRVEQEPYFFYRWNTGHPLVNTKELGRRTLLRESIRPDQSILAQKRDADLYPELTWTASQLEAIRFYREWTFGRNAAPRVRQQTDQANDRLEPDGSNLGLVLNRLRMNLAVRRQLVEALRAVYDGIEDVDVRVEGGTAQVFLIEQAGAIPATRLSDGTLRYLSLLALLCDPTPPPLVILEEPELGLHPDVLPGLARLLVEASSRAQWIITTHAPGLIDALSEQTDAVLVCERGSDGTHLERLDADQLAPWLEKFRLGELWMRGQIGGTRW